MSVGGDFGRNSNNGDTVAGRSGVMLRPGSVDGPITATATATEAAAATAAPASLTVVSAQRKYGSRTGARSAMQLSSGKQERGGGKPGGVPENRGAGARSEVEKARSFLYEFMDGAGQDGKKGGRNSRSGTRDSVSPVLTARTLTASAPDKTSSSEQHRGSTERRMMPGSPTKSSIKTLRQLRNGAAAGSSSNSSSGGGGGGGSKLRRSNSSGIGRSSGGSGSGRGAGGAGGAGGESDRGTSWAKVESASTHNDAKLVRTVSQEEAYASHQLLVAHLWKELAVARKRKAKLLASAAERQRPRFASPSADSHSESSEAEELAGLHQENSKEFQKIKVQILEVSSDIDDLVMELEKLGYLPLMGGVGAGRAPSRKTKPASRKPVMWNNPDKRILGRRPKDPPPPPGTPRRGNLGNNLW